MLFFIVNVNTNVSKYDTNERGMKQLRIASKELKFLEFEIERGNRRKGNKKKKI